MAAQRTFYDILGIPRTATLDQIKKRYRELARQYHPDVSKDKANAAKVFGEIAKAYTTLSNPEERSAYDAELMLRERRAAAAAGRASSPPPFPGTAPPPPGRPSPPRRTARAPSPTSCAASWRT